MLGQFLVLVSGSRMIEVELIELFQGLFVEIVESFGMPGVGGGGFCALFLLLLVGGRG